MVGHWVSVATLPTLSFPHPAQRPRVSARSPQGGGNKEFQTGKFQTKQTPGSERERDDGVSDYAHRSQEGG